MGTPSTTNARGWTVTGPLNERQHQIMKLICDGFTHVEIASRIKVSRVCVSENVIAARCKMGVSNTPAAASLYGQWLLLGDLAGWAEKRILPYPGPTSEAFREVAQHVRGYAQNLIP